MTDKQNKFYTSISKYYSEIFPYKPVQLQFVNNGLGNLKDKQILDIGCATGELAFNLTGNGAKVTGIDLNDNLLQQAKMNKSRDNLLFRGGNMLELEKYFHTGQFDAVLCFGNTLVHLQTIEFIQQMLKAVYTVLKPGGKFFIQILNYDYILADQISLLPLIETENIRFIRKYKIEMNSPLIRFQTELYVKKEDKTVSNETLLFALKSVELTDLLNNNSFKNIKLFSDFKQNVFGGNHLPLVVSAVK